ncbi:MAG: ABC transporter substrate-binding protein [Halothiobacillaceae bacterium]
MRRRRFLQLAAGVAVMPSVSMAGAGITVTDMAQRTVKLPGVPRRVVTVGGVPAMGSFLFALGVGGQVVNGLPAFACGARWADHLRFAPQMADQPAAQGSGGTPALETLLALRPDVVFTMIPQALEPMERVGLPVVYLSWKEAEIGPWASVQTSMRLMGRVLGREEAAARYLVWADDLLKQVSQRLPETRPPVLFVNLQTMSQQFRIVNQWITAAGGHSVTADENNQQDHLALSLEQVLSWDPEVLLLWGEIDQERVLSDPRWAQLAAVRTGRVHVTPSIAHPWASWTAEHPLMVLWAAQRLHPNVFSVAEVLSAARMFYHHFCNVAFTDAELRERLYQEV